MQLNALLKNLTKEMMRPCAGLPLILVAVEMHTLERGLILEGKELRVKKQQLVIYAIFFFFFGGLRQCVRGGGSPPRSPFISVTALRTLKGD